MNANESLATGLTRPIWEIGKKISSIKIVDLNRFVHANCDRIAQRLRTRCACLDKICKKNPHIRAVFEIVLQKRRGKKMARGRKIDYSFDHLNFVKKQIPLFLS